MPEKQYIVRPDDKNQWILYKVGGGNFDVVGWFPAKEDADLACAAFVRLANMEDASMGRERMSVAEFRRKGYLQELNRQFLHPLGLALEVVAEEGGLEMLGGIWDCRDDPVGVVFDDSLLREPDTVEKAEFIRSEFERRRLPRLKSLGIIQQSVPGPKP